MANNRRPRSARDFAHGPDLDREWIRPGPDYRDNGGDPGDRERDDRDSRRSASDPSDADRGSQPHYRGFQEAFGFAAPPNYPFSVIASDARRGKFFGRGPKGYRRSNERIHEEVSDRLMTHPDIDASDVEVRVANGIVTLTGTVDDRHQKRLAEYIAEDAVGVDDVDNRLTVRHGFWATVMGERATERELPAPAARRTPTASKEAGRASAARNAARRDADAR